MSTRIACSACGQHVPLFSRRAQCECGGLLEVIQSPSIGSGTLRSRFDRRVRDAAGSRNGVWRFRELLLPSAGPIVSHPEGDTPLYRREAVARYVGIPDLALKHEGENPTGSFKDRGMTVAVTHAVRARATAVACASTGNTSASMAAYAAQAGLPALVFVPRGKVTPGKLAQSLAYGARTLLVRGDFDACLRLCREVADVFGITLLNSINPWRIEGQKTIVLELLQQRSWRPPDWIVVPAGNLGNTAAFGKALFEARAIGLIGSTPRVAAIQAAGANPFYRSFCRGFGRRFRVKAETIASAIRIGDPASHDRAVRTIRDTDGIVATVTDREILAAKVVVDSAGIGCEPASAAAVAGARKLAERGVIRRRDSVVAILTGHLLKDPDTIGAPRGSGPRRANRPVEIGADLATVARVLKDQGWRRMGDGS